MRAKAKAAAIVTFACTALLAARPAEAAGTCDVLATMDAATISSALAHMSPDVLGKPADMWTERDFASLLGKAEACHGKPRGMKYRVDAAYWRSQMKPAMEKVLPVSARTSAILSAYAPRWSWGDLPSCIKVLNWKRDPVWLDDNAEEIFGGKLAVIGKEGRTLVSGFARECQSVMETALDANRMDVSAAGKIIADIELSVERENAVEEEGPDELAPDLRVTHEGRRVPLSYVAPRTRRMVEAANYAEKRGLKLTTDQMIMLSTWADKWKQKPGPDGLYALAVRKVISKHMFER